MPGCAARRCLPVSADRLAQWQADEAAVLAHRAQPAGAIPPAQALGRSGLDVLHDMLAGRLPAAPMAETLDFLLVHVGHGKAVFQGRPGPRFFNPMGTVHGGWYATLLDSAVGCAVHTTMPPGRGYTTLELKLNLVRALGPDVPLVRAEGRTINVGRQVATAEGRLIGPDGKLYAHATTTCLIFDLPSRAGG
jgi:uncharacterized protein (TIGR00369 family)